MFKKNKNDFYLGEFYIESCTGVHQNKKLSKFGRLSLKGTCNNKKVKIFECYNKTHANFVRAIMCHPKYKEFFPKVYGIHGSIIIAEWVEGQTLQVKHIYNNEALLDKITRFFNIIHGKVPSEIKKLDYGFDYSKDLLETRFKQCCHTLELNSFCERVLSSANKAYQLSSTQLSHPDISPPNILVSQKDNQLKIIDNELINMSSLYHIDVINLSFFLDHKKTKACGSNNKIYEDTKKILSCLSKEDVMNIWLMRYVGTKFQSGDIKTVIALSENSFSENLNLFSFLDLICPK